MKNSFIKKTLIIAVFLVILTSTNVFAYAFFNDFTREDEVTIYLGDWLDDSIPITNAQEFYDCVTNENSMSTDYYYLANDIDFSDYTWNYSNDVIFRGTIDGNNHTISNLTVTTTDTSVKYFGLFPRIEDATIKNIKFDNLNTTIDSSTLSNSNMRAGLIVGRIHDGINNILNLEITNSSVIGSNNQGTGGIIGQVYGKTCTVNIDSIKATNLKVFTKEANVGGIVGFVYGNQSTVNISNIDIQTEIYAIYSSSYLGGIVGKIISGSTVTIENVMIDITTQNTFVDYSIYMNAYPKRYLGGVVGYNLTSSLTINNVFVTGKIVSYSKIYAKYVSSLIGRNSGSYTADNAYYSDILFLQKDGSTAYSEVANSRGASAELVLNNALPDISWWNLFYQNFDQTKWTQNSSGYLSLDM